MNCADTFSPQDPPFNAQTCHFDWSAVYCTQCFLCKYSQIKLHYYYYIVLLLILQCNVVSVMIGGAYLGRKSENGNRRKERGHH